MVLFRLYSSILLALFQYLNISSQAHKTNWQQNWFYITMAILYELELQKIVSDNSTHSNVPVFQLDQWKMLARWWRSSDSSSQYSWLLVFTLLDLYEHHIDHVPFSCYCTLSRTAYIPVYVTFIHSASTLWRGTILTVASQHFLCWLMMAQNSHSSFMFFSADFHSGHTVESE